MHFTDLILTCRNSVESIRFVDGVNFFHGKISAGKSTIANLIDFCLGGDLVKTPAVRQEMVSVSLSGIFGSNEVMFEREKGSNHIQVSWKHADVSESVLAPITPSDTALIEGTNIFNLSDLVFYFLGLRPIKMRKNQREPEAEMIRLGFRDVLKFCYLQQRKLDSSFFDLNAPILQSHSRMAMRFFVGYYSEALSDLEQKLAQVQVDRKRKLSTITEISAFLKENDVQSSAEIEIEVTRFELEIRAIEREMIRIREGFDAPKHLVDDLRDRLRSLSSQLDSEKVTLSDLVERVEEQKALRAELISSRMKLARASTATAVLSGVNFHLCPSCGTDVRPKNNNIEECNLCGSHSLQNAPGKVTTEATDADLKARISELEDSITRHHRAIARQERAVTSLTAQKSVMDAQLRQELAQYDSDYLAASRQLERNLAVFQERVRSLRSLQKLPARVMALENECDLLKTQETKLMREIDQEKEKLGKADAILADLESEYASLLRKVKYPGMNESDTVQINRTSFMPSILPNGDAARSFDFDDAGSAGKSTLLNVCFGLALHSVAARRQLPLPDFLMIDSPMKNISADVNREMFVAFFDALYELAEGDLRNTQFIIIENDFLSPASKDLSLMERYMAQNDKDHPPLISYYHGH